MSFLDISRNGGTSGRMGALLLKDLLIQEKNKANQCQCLESIALDYFEWQWFAFYRTCSLKNFQSHHQNNHAPHSFLLMCYKIPLLYLFFYKIIYFLVFMYVKNLCDSFCQSNSFKAFTTSNVAHFIPGFFPGGNQSAETSSIWKGMICKATALYKQDLSPFTCIFLRIYLFQHMHWLPQTVYHH